MKFKKRDKKHTQEGYRHWQIWCCLKVILCDPYLSALEAFARRRAIQIHVYFTLL